jgi:hypothetical protein
MYAGFGISNTNPALFLNRWLGVATNYKSASIECNVAGELVFANSTGTLDISAQSYTERMRLDSSGRLGLGTSSPDSPLHVRSTDSLGVQIHNPTGTTASLARLYLGCTSTLLPRQRGVALVGELNADASHNMQFWVSATSGAGPSEMMRLTNTGHLGIGGNPDIYNTDANDLVIAKTGNVGLTISSANSGNTNIFFADGTTGNENFRGIVSYKHSTDSMDFSTSGATRVTIDSTGRLGIGTTSPNNSLDVVSDSGGIAVNIRNRSANDYGYLRFQNNAGSSTQASIGNVGGQLTFETGTTERARIDSSGRLLVGTSTSTSVTGLGYSGKAQFANNGNAALALHGYYGDGFEYGADLLLTRSRSGTIGTNTIVQSGDDIGTLFFAGANGTGYDFAASIGAFVDGTPGASSDMPGRLVFSTTADGASSPTERVRINSSGRLLIGTSIQSGTGGTLCVNNGIGIVNNTTARFATVEHGSGASGTFTTITISATVQSSTASVIFETLMTGFSGVYLDNVIGQYSAQAAVTMRNNASAGTSAALTVDVTTTIYTLTITTSVTHPVVKVKVTAGGLAGDITLPTITFA